jgi:O-antigen/teichoic acid export membrane protein
MSARYVSSLAARLAGKEPFAAFVRSVGALSSVRLAGGLTLFVSEVLLARWMGHESFGIYSYAWAWVATLAAVAGLGLPAAGVRFVAAYRAKQEHARARGILSFATRATLAAAAGLAIVAIVIVGWAAPDSPYTSALQVAFVAIPALALLNLDAAFARSFGWMALSASAEQLVRPLVLIGLGALCVMWRPSLSAAGWAVLCALAYFTAAGWQHVAVRDRVGREIPRGDREYLARTWLRVGAGMLVLVVAQIIRVNVDLVVVGTLLGPGELGVYTAAVRAATLVAFFLSVSSLVAQPRMAEMYAQDRRDDLRRFVRSSTRMTFLVSLVIGVMLALVGRHVLALFGAEFVSGYRVLLILIAGHILAAASGPLTSLLMMIGRHDRAAAIHVLSMLVATALVVPLTSRYGLPGAALATSAGLVLTQIALRVAARRALQA